MLHIEHCTFGFDERPILSDITVHCEHSSITGIVGFNGHGKTTLFRLIAGQAIPQHGRITLKGRAIHTRDVAFLPTEPFFYQLLTGKEYLALLSHGNKEFAIERWGEVFDLPLHDVVDAYSAGMKKKLAFLGILALDRPVIVLDEPFNQLDLESNYLFIQILKKLQQNGKIILMSSHIYEPLAELCSAIHWLSNGMIERTFLPEQYHDINDTMFRIHQEKFALITAII